MIKSKKYIIFTIFIVFLLVLFLSLTMKRDNSIDEEILKDADSFDNVFEIDRSNTLDEHYGKYLPEIRYVMTTTEDLDNIYSPYYKFNNNRYYFTVTKRYETANELTGREILAYVDLKTGEKHYICSDPLCTHTEMEECKYLNLTEEFFFADKNIFYTTFIDGFFDEQAHNKPLRWSIYRVNLTTDDIQIVYQCKEDYTKEGIRLSFIHGNKLYFYEVEAIENKSGNTQKLYTYYNTLKVLNTDTNKVEYLRDIPHEYMNTTEDFIFYISKNTVYFHSPKEIFSTDLSFKNKEIIYVLNNDECLGDYYYDETTNELFFNIQNNEQNIGNIYVYANDKINNVDMPHENIYCFQLTKNKIYYSIYDPLYYGISPREIDVYDFTGGKIYVTDRYDTEKTDLVFDCSGDFTVHTDVYRHIIVGDYLYFDYMQFMSDGKYVWFSSALELKKIRANMMEQTIKYLNFD